MKSGWVSPKKLRAAIQRLSELKVVSPARKRDLNLVLSAAEHHAQHLDYVEREFIRSREEMKREAERMEIWYSTPG